MISYPCFFLVTGIGSCLQVMNFNECVNSLFRFIIKFQHNALWLAETAYFITEQSTGWLSWLSNFCFGILTNFITLDEDWIAHALYLSARSFYPMYIACDKRKSKLELFYSLFIEFSSFFGSRLKHMLARSLKLLLRLYRSDLTPCKCWSSFGFFLGLPASFLVARLILMSGR